MPAKTETDGTNEVPLLQQSSTTTLEIIRDDTFFCQDIYLQVEKVLFKLPRSVFNGSELFRNMLEIPQPPGHPVDGSDEDHPLRLDGHTAADFRQLMRIALPIQSSSSEELTTDEWKAVLSLSTAWLFESIRKTAIKSLNQARLDPVEKLIIAVKYHVDEWTVDVLNTIAQRNEPLDITDANQLLPVVGVEYLLKIARVRENEPVQAVAGNSGCYCSNHGVHLPAGSSCSTTGVSSARSQRDFRPLIRQVFNLDD